MKKLSEILIFLWNFLNKKLPPRVNKLLIVLAGFHIAVIVLGILFLTTKCLNFTISHEKHFAVTLTKEEFQTRFVPFLSNIDEADIKSFEYTYDEGWIMYKSFIKITFSDSVAYVVLEKSLGDFKWIRLKENTEDLANIYEVFIDDCNFPIHKQGNKKDRIPEWFNPQDGVEVYACLLRDWKDGMRSESMLYYPLEHTLYMVAFGYLKTE